MSTTRNNADTDHITIMEFFTQQLLCEELHDRDVIWYCLCSGPSPHSSENIFSFMILSPLQIPPHG